MTAALLDHLYVGTDGKLCKIGISNNPDRRAAFLKIRLVKTWKRPWAREIETTVKGILAYARARETEWFKIDLGEMLFEVTRSVRISDDWRAIELGIEPSPRPVGDEPPFQPPFELAWADLGATVKEHWSDDLRILKPEWFGFVRVTKTDR